ncbi:hypothetical protein SLA2020_049540 [Shorea laevis]
MTMVKAPTVMGGSYLFTDEETDSNLCSSEWYWKIQAVISSRFFCDIVRKCCCGLKASRLRRSPAYWILLNFQLVVPSGLAREWSSGIGLLGYVGSFDISRFLSLNYQERAPQLPGPEDAQIFSNTTAVSQLHPRLGMVSPNFRPSSADLSCFFLFAKSTCVLVEGNQSLSDASD